jgi:hypothetical protein
MYTGLSGLGDVTDWLLHPIDAVKNKLADFLALPNRWAVWRVKATVYKTRGTPEQRAAASQLLTLLDGLDAAWRKARAMMQLGSSQTVGGSGSAGGFVMLSGLGFVPVLVGVVGSVIVLVHLLWSVFQGDGVAGRIVSSLEAGDITAAEAHALIQSLPDTPDGPLTSLARELGSVVKMALVGGLGVVVAVNVLPMLLRPRRQSS